MVGTEMLRILDERDFPVGELRAYASPRSEGRKLPFRDGEVSVRGASRRLLRRPRPRRRRRRRADSSREWTPQAAAAGAMVVDKSSAFRMDPDVPLVIAEVNPEDLARPPERHLVVPELHDDDPRHRAGAAASRRAHRPHGRVDVPVGVGCRTSRPARARRAVDEARRPHRGTASRRHARRARSSRARCGASRSPATSSRSRAR